MKIRFLLLLCAIQFLGNLRTVSAQEFRTDYDVSYTLPVTDTEVARAQYKITLTNLKSDTYIDSYSITFPESFAISDVSASDDEGRIEPRIEKSTGGNVIRLDANEPIVGRKNVTKFIVEFNQRNLFRKTGSVWEVMLPTIENRREGSYKVSVSIPPNGEPLSVAKPKPSQIRSGVIEWENPVEKTIYAVFGDKQTYNVELTYDIENIGPLSQAVDIALPPDTLYQKIFLKSLEPDPETVRTDKDGNYIATYVLKSKHEAQIVFNGSVVVFPNSRDEVREEVERAYRDNKNNLLKKHDVWSLRPSKTISGLTSAEAINSYIISALQYDAERTKQGSDRRRYGADGALAAPDRAVCLEYSDTFIAIARGNGIPAREIQGFAYTDNPLFRPVSLVTDVLHSWPEYYDESSGLWKQIDPTWQDTSGIDYFNSFDLNHIAFAIHGTDPRFPLPAGMYKTIQKKYVSVTATDEGPEEVKQIAVDIDSLNLKYRITAGTENRGMFTVTNRGNTYRYDIPVEIRSPGLTVKPDVDSIASLAPGERKKIDFTYSSAQKKGTFETDMTARVDGRVLFTKRISVTPSSYIITIYLAGGLIAVSALAVILIRTYVTKRT